MPEIHITLSSLYDGGSFHLVTSTFYPQCPATGPLNPKKKKPYINNFTQCTYPSAYEGRFLKMGAGAYTYRDADTTYESDTLFMGYLQNPTKVYALVLTDPKNYWTTSDEYAYACSSGSSCLAITACSANSIWYEGGYAGDCGTSSCHTITIYNESPFATPSAYAMRCIEDEPANVLYRRLPVSTTATTTASTTSSSKTATSAGPVPTSSQTPAPQPQPSKAWIAGAVVGPIAGVAIIAGLIAWFIIRRKREPAPPYTPAAQMPPSELMSEDQHTARPVHEMNNDTQIHELTTPPMEQKANDKPDALPMQELNHDAQVFELESSDVPRK